MSIYITNHIGSFYSTIGVWADKTNNLVIWFANWPGYYGL